MFSFRRLLSAFTPNDDRQTRGDEHAEIEISDDSNEENGVGMNSGSADNDKHSGSENKKRKRREGKISSCIKLNLLLKNQNYYFIIIYRSRK
jgi:hypothetical protein